MLNRVIYPPDQVSVDGPIIFLAGPIQGAPNWQPMATQLIHDRDAKIVVANPRRLEVFAKDDAEAYNRQVDWETWGLNEATIILFWLAREETHNCERAYAQTSRFELAERKQERLPYTKLAVGVEAGFTNAKYIRRRFGQDRPDVPICDSLEATVDAALALLKKAS